MQKTDRILTIPEILYPDRDLMKRKKRLSVLYPFKKQTVLRIFQNRIYDPSLFMGSCRPDLFICLSFGLRRPEIFSVPSGNACHTYCLSLHSSPVFMLALHEPVRLGFLQQAIFPEISVQVTVYDPFLYFPSDPVRSGNLCCDAQKFSDHYRQRKKLFLDQTVLYRLSVFFSDILPFRFRFSDLRTRHNRIFRHAAVQFFTEKGLVSSLSAVLIVIFLFRRFMLSSTPPAEFQNGFSDHAFYVSSRLPAAVIFCTRKIPVPIHRRLLKRNLNLLKIPALISSHSRRGICHHGNNAECFS